MTILTDLALRRPAVTLLLAVALLLGGGAAALQLNQELTPDLSFPFITVVTLQPGADAVDVAEGVTKPVESALASVAGLRSVQSTSTDGLSIVATQFDFGHDMRAAEQDIARLVANVRLPQGATAPQVSRIDLNQALPIVQLSLSGPAGLEEADRVARQELLPKLKAIDGVQSAEVTGGLARRIDVVLDPSRMRQAGIGVQQVTGALLASNVSIPAGSLPGPDGLISVRVIGQLTAVEQIGDLVVGARGAAPATPAPGGPGVPGAPSPAAGTAQLVRLRDVASARVVSVPSGGISRTNGEPGIAIAVFKSQGANTVSVADGVREVIEASRGSLGDRLRISTILDGSVPVRESITGLSREGSIGAVAAVLVVWAFLMSVRSALVVGVSIPLSVLAALLLLWGQGFTLNILTLGGLTIAVGRVVDDSIVVLENIFRHVREGDDLEHSVRAGTREVSTAILGSTLTTIAVFLPLTFTGGVVGVLFRPFALTVTYALLASLVVAAAVVPVIARAFVARQLGRGGSAEGRGPLQRAYGRALSWSLRHRLAALGGAALLFAASLALVPLIPTSFIPESSQKQFFVAVAPATGAPTPERALELAQAAERIIAELPSVRLHTTTIAGGGSNLFSVGSALQGQGTGGATIIVVLEPSADLAAVTQLARERLRDVPGATTRVQSMGGGGFSSQLQLSLRGEDADKVREAGERALAEIQRIPGVQRATSPALGTRSSLAVTVDAQRARAVGLTPAQVALQLRELTMSQTVTQVRIGGERLDLVVRSDPAALGDLAAIPVGRPATPLSQVATIQRAETATVVTRLDQLPAVTISGTITGRSTGEVNADVRTRIAALSLPAGVEVVYGGTLQQFQESFSGLFIGIALAIVIVYAVMVIVMGSLLGPFAIMFSLPLALVGALAALALTGRSLGLPALFGVLMLVGIVVSNGIVLIDFVQQLRERGASPREALLTGGRLRLRPVLMTAAATIVALLPMSFGLTEGAIIAAELATVVIGGLLTSTLLTLVVVPVVYSLLVGRGAARPERQP